METSLLPLSAAARRASERAADAALEAARHARASLVYHFGLSGALRALARAERRASVALYASTRLYTAARVAEAAGAGRGDPPEWGKEDRILAARIMRESAAALLGAQSALLAFARAIREDGPTLRGVEPSAADVDRALSALASEARHDCAQCAGFATARHDATCAERDR